MDDPLLGTVIDDRYHLTRVIGRGGMGVVYRAEDLRLSNRPCAVKLLLGPAIDTHSQEGARFEREVEIISRMRSRHVVQIFDTGQLEDGRRFIVMELLEGRTLSATIRKEGPLPPHRAVHLARGVVAGLAEAHDQGVVHRDLKPANIFVSLTRAGDEVARILDFGIAKDTAEGGEDLTGRSMLIGTPKYMAPEQFLKRQPDGRTDLYALGLVLYEMLAGRPPFHARTPVPPNIGSMPDEFRVGWLHVNQAPVPLETDERLWAVVDRLLAKDPDQRFPSAISVLEAFSALDPASLERPAPRITAEVGMADPDPASTSGFPVLGEALHLKAHSSRRPGLWLALAALLALGVGLGWWFTRAPAEPPITITDESPDEATAPGVAPGRTAGAPGGPPPRMCTHEVQTRPPGASLEIAGESKGLTPANVSRRCDQTVELVLRLPSYATATRTLSGPEDESALMVELEPLPSTDPPAERSATARVREPPSSPTGAGPKTRRPPTSPGDAEDAPPPAGSSDRANVRPAAGGRPTAGAGLKSARTPPAGSGPKPAGSGPKPAGSGPKPAGSGPKPAGSGPKPAGSGPKPAGSGPKPDRRPPVSPLPF